MSIRFEASWCGSDLGGHRPCPNTYERYSHDPVPPLKKRRAQRLSHDDASTAEAGSLFGRT
ncbi:hypothetical protein [Streptomyces chartreusis]